MSVIVNAPPAQREAKRDAGSALGGCIIAVGLIMFGLWFGVRATIDFAHGALNDPEAGQAAEMRMLQESMNCEPGEVLQITPLPGGAKSVRCAAGANMPPVRRQAEGEQRG